LLTGNLPAAGKVWLSMRGWRYGWSIEPDGTGHFLTSAIGSMAPGPCRTDVLVLLLCVSGGQSAAEVNKVKQLNVVNARLSNWR
jgi:hypothetical protein